MPNPIAESSQRVPSFLRALVLGAACVACAYFCITATGPYAWVVRLQIQFFEAYYLKLSILLTILVCLVPAGLLLAVMGMFFRGDETTDFSAGGVPGQIRAPSSIAQRIERAPRSFGIMLLGIVSAGVGGFFLAKSMMYGDLTPYRLTADSEWPPPSRYLELSGAIIPHSAMVWSDDTTHANTVYVLLGPLAGSAPTAAANPSGNTGGGKDEPPPATAAKPDSAAAGDGGAATPTTAATGAPPEYRIVLKVSESTYNRLRFGEPVQGTLERAPSGIVAGDLRDAGFTLADDVRIFAVDNTPEQTRTIGLIALAAGLLGTLINGALFLFFSRER